MRVSNSNLWAALALAGALGCGRAAVPVDKLADTRSAIHAAEEVGARRHAAASVHLKLARDRLATAERLVRSDDIDRAKLYLSESMADADLALAITRREEEQTAATHAREEVAKLQARAQMGAPIEGETSP